MPTSRSSVFTVLKNRASPISVFVIVILIWQYVSSNSLVSQFLLPTPISVVAEFFSASVNWPTQIFITLKEILVGFFFGALGGLALAIMVTESAFLRKTLMPYLIGIEAIPKIAIAPLIYILLGFNDFARIIMVILLVFFPIVLTTLTGLVDVDRNLIYLMKTLGAGETEILYKVRLPNSTPQLFVGLKLGVLAAVIGAVIAEFVSSTAGLGFLIISAQSTFNTSLAFAAFTLLAILSLTLYGSIELIGYLTMPWYRKK
jgi:NitT/TauT family transport system permease protein